MGHSRDSSSGFGKKIATMATPESKPLGITAPLSTALPTESENQASNALIEELKKQDNYESHADTQKRYVMSAKCLYILCATGLLHHQRTSLHTY